MKKMLQKKPSKKAQEDPVMVDAKLVLRRKPGKEEGYLMIGKKYLFGMSKQKTISSMRFWKF